MTFLAEFSLDIQYSAGSLEYLARCLIIYCLLTLSASGNDTSPGGDVGMLQTLVLEPSWLFLWLMARQADPALIPYFAKAQTRSAEFSLRTLHGLELLYFCPKPGII